MTETYFKTLTEADMFKFNGVIINVTKGTVLTNIIEDISLSYSNNSKSIKSLTASFSIDDTSLITTGDIIEIKAVHKLKEIVILKGKAELQERKLNNSLIHNLQVIVYDEIKDLFSKTVSKDTFAFDNWVYYKNNENNSLLFNIIKELGITVDNVVFEDIRDSQTRLIKIPFMVFTKGNKWIDELETVIDCIKGRMYIDNNNKVVIKGGLYNPEENIICHFNQTNILNSVTQKYSYAKYNGIRKTFDSYSYLENQPCFNLAQKIEVEVGTIPENQNKIMSIKYITDVITQYNLTKATGYYFNELSEKVDVNLIEGTHYDFVSFINSGAQVKFYNPYASKLYIENFEIKGVPVVKYEDNESIVKNTDVETEEQENFPTVNKNKYIQEMQFATEIAEYEYREECLDGIELSFKSFFCPFVMIGDLIEVIIDDISTPARVTNISHTISKTKGFSSEITAVKIDTSVQTFKYNTVESLKSNGEYIETINNLQDQIENIEAPPIDEDLLNKLNAKGFIQEAEPTATAEGDVWYQPSTKIFKVWKNGTWQTAMEDDIMPALKSSIMAQAGVFRIGNNDTEAGIFFQYDEDINNPVFGRTDPTNIARIVINKDAGIIIQNANNKLAFNVKNPLKPAEITSQLLMGVTNPEDTKHQGTIFQIGEENTGTYIKLTDGKVKQEVAGTDLANFVDDIGKGKFEINANTQVNGVLEVYSNDKGIISYDGTTQVNSTKRIVIKGGEILFQEKG
jgi:hypothetical protein